ncbi:3-oxoacyl-ACP reductase [Leptospira yasudae]|uniref:3-oxoacyl-ACP reductase n=1 Tax=Leptospira yasudae TaxID=2202201 RepID=A0ABX9M3Y0_9LEPT|nr:glucose 1-dehydrogenase [Leptospira yasudae]MBW0432223.1 glucose 1-dehydrogenase [Leptospira yasudae]RHX79806.1 3-oxoacyl-ACP reductase [Leptospira yasudae]RHX96361.1 3-oxoacyl-ACP reductase [Leptospira yasudae]TGK23061.1 glucose 1-dehydrogenase [Leptospira yasudae]TGM03369.1 glucose 1-dehydrogenase [Leptospira yasudae]
MKDKVAMVTGGSTGIGKAVVQEFVSKGVKVVFCGRRLDEGKKLESEVRSQGGDVHFVVCDVTSGEQVKKVVDTAVEKFGRLDFGVNNAGIMGANHPLHEYPEAVWDNVVNVNLKGAWLSMKVQIPEIIKAGGGAVVNVSSISGINGVVGINPYSAAKHGVVGLTKSAALEYAKKNVRINAICPGAVKTEILDELFHLAKDPIEAEKQLVKLHPMHRIATPEEIAKTVIWLCGDDSTFITGTAIPVDGGYSAK